MPRVSFLVLSVLGFVWWLLAAPGPLGWPVAVAGVALGGFLHYELGGAGTVRPHLSGLLRFMPFFFVQMIRGGIDVSRRALSPSLPLDPDLLPYRTWLPEGLARVFFVNSISVLPGTFSARVEADEITVHRLDRAMLSESLLAELEERVGGLFGLEPEGALPGGSGEAGGTSDDEPESV